jgi:hypothetical protein
MERGKLLCDEIRQLHAGNIESRPVNSNTSRVFATLAVILPQRREGTQSFFESLYGFVVHIGKT